MQPVLQAFAGPGIEQAGRTMVHSFRARIGLQRSPRPSIHLPPVLLCVAARSESGTGVEAGGGPLCPFGGPSPAGARAVGRSRDAARLEASALLRAPEAVRRTPLWGEQKTFGRAQGPDHRH